MASITIHVIQPNLFVCKLSVTVADGNLVIWSRGARRAPGQERLTDRWGKALVRKLKRYEWVDGALFDDRTMHLVCHDVQAVPNDELVDLFDRMMSTRAVEINIVRHGLAPPDNYVHVELPFPTIAPRVR